MNDVIIIEGTTYISSKRASEIGAYSQDYIGQLARKGAIKAQRIGGLWYIAEDSLKTHKEKAESYVPRPPSSAQGSADPDAIVSFDGKEYVSATKGAMLTGYHPDYVSQLARDGTVLSRQIGSRWYLERETLTAHKKKKDALLAAVQAESVGLHPRSSKVSDAGIAGVLDSDAGPHMTYIREDGHLFPEITVASKSKEVSRLGEMPSSALNLKPISIPIRISDPLTNTDAIAMRIRSNKKAGLAQKRFMSPSALASAIATIVIVVLVGYVSIQNSAVYTQISKSSGFAVVNAASEALSRIGDIIEQIIAPGIQYSRLR